MFSKTVFRLVNILVKYFDNFKMFKYHSAQICVVIVVLVAYSFGKPWMNFVLVSLIRWPLQKLKVSCLWIIISFWHKKIKFYEIIFLLCS